MDSLKLDIKFDAEGFIDALKRLLNKKLNEREIKDIQISKFGYMTVDCTDGSSFIFDFDRDISLVKFMKLEEND